jgi:hypothetical protein
MKTAVEQFVNKPPSIPTNDKIEFLINTETQTDLIPVELSWLAATDDHTPSEGLTYAIKLEQHKAVKKLCLRTQILTECVKRGKREC